MTLEVVVVGSEVVMVGDAAYGLDGGDSSVVRSVSASALSSSRWSPRPSHVDAVFPCLLQHVVDHNVERSGDVLVLVQVGRIWVRSQIIEAIWFLVGSIMAMSRCEELVDEAVRCTVRMINPAFVDQDPRDDALRGSHLIRHRLDVRTHERRAASIAIVDSVGVTSCRQLVSVPASYPGTNGSSSVMTISKRKR